MNDRVPLQQSQEKAEETKPIQPTKQGSEMGFMDDIEYHRMADQMDMSYEDRKDVHNAEKLSFLADWAKEETKSEDRLQQALAIKNLSKMLGLNLVGKELINRLYQYARLDQQRKQIEKEMDLVK